jgi:hypothetical protein
MAAKTHTSQTAFLCLFALTNWALMHRYGLVGDGELYAMQAMARIHPALHADVYLSAASLDKFTLFSPLYAWTIGLLGLLNAGVVLFSVCTVALFAAAWAIAKELWDEHIAWFVVGMLIIAASNYGASGVFQYAENYLTARSMAEALVAISLACFFRGLVKLGWAIAALALFIHPLMALPGLLLLACLSLPWRYCLAGAAGGAALCLLIIVAAWLIDSNSGYLAIMSGQWLDMVRERSQFLFLKYWHIADWEMHARVFLCLMLGAASAPDPRVRRLCAAASLVGATGLLIALMAGTLGPVAILLQGQAWRWFWIAAFAAVMVLVPTAVRLWRDGGCGAVGAVLLITGWTFPPVHGAYLVAAALILWSVRSRVRPPTQAFLKATAYALIGVTLLWALANIWSLATAPPVVNSEEPVLIERLRSIWALQIPALLLAMLFGWAIQRIGNVRAPYTLGGAALLAVLCAFALHGALHQISTLGSRGEIEAFADWRAAIPPTDNVLIVPGRNSAAFIWFSLQRPSYLTVNQSAGVVFSAVTSLEIRRRSQVLLPIEDPDWKLLTQYVQKQSGEKVPEQSRPLTRERLAAICADPQLGFVIAKESLDFAAITHSRPGAWQGWKLYDCRRVRNLAATA